ncbi:hypothetical protein SCOR_34855 [Sulfidibacter corallicola]
MRPAVAPTRHDAPLMNAGTPQRFASISYPLETRWSVCRIIGNPAADLGGDSAVNIRTRFPNEKRPRQCRGLLGFRSR